MTDGARRWLALAVFVLLCYGASFVGGYFTSAGLGSWYDALAKPSWTPGGTVISVVWSILFALMAIAGWLVWLHGGVFGQPVAMSLFILQLTLNILWSGLFFTLRMPGAALVEIVFLEIAILGTIVAFARVSSAAALLMVPYAFWVAFAAALNFAIWRMNPGA